MNEAEKIDKQKELIERIGRQHEKDGFSPVAGRILGLLMVMDKEEYTFDEIVQEIQISKSSASTALKHLELKGVIEYITYPGDRKRYFRFVSTDIDQMIDEFEQKMKQSSEIINEILALKKDPNSRNAEFLSDLNAGIHFFIKQLDKFREENKRMH